MNGLWRRYLQGRTRMAAVTLCAAVALASIGGVVVRRQVVAGRALAERERALARLGEVEARCARGELPTREQLRALQSLFGGERLRAERRGDAVFLVFAAGAGGFEALAEVRAR